MKKEWGGKKYVADLRVSRVRRCEFCKHSEYSQLRLSPQLGNAATYDRITYVGSCTVVFIHKNLIHFKKTRKREVKRIKESQKRHTPGIEPGTLRIGSSRLTSAATDETNIISPFRIH